MLGTKTIVAKASIKLDPLLLKREISQDLQLCDPNNLRKNAGGKIRIVLKLREPFLKPEVSILKKHWICVSFEHPLPDTPQKTKRKETSNEGAINRQTPIMLKPTPDQQQMENLISEFEE